MKIKIKYKSNNKMEYKKEMTIKITNNNINIKNKQN